MTEKTTVKTLLGGLPPHRGIITVIDGCPASLTWIGPVSGHRARVFSVEHFGQTGMVSTLYRHHGIDVRAIIRAAETLAPRRLIRSLRLAG